MIIYVSKYRYLTYTYILMLNLNWINIMTIIILKYCSHNYLLCSSCFLNPTAYLCHLSNLLIYSCIYVFQFQWLCYVMLFHSMYINANSLNSTCLFISCVHILTHLIQIHSNLGDFLVLHLTVFWQNHTKSPSQLVWVRLLLSEILIQTLRIFSINVKKTFTSFTVICFELSSNILRNWSQAYSYCTYVDIIRIWWILVPSGTVCFRKSPYAINHWTN